MRYRAYGDVRGIVRREHRARNKRMQRRLIEELRALIVPLQAAIYTDSQYVQKGITEWIRCWKVRVWRAAAKEPVRNVDKCL